MRITESEVSESRRVRRVCWAARIMSLVPGAVPILALGGLFIYEDTGVGSLSEPLLDYFQLTVIFYGFPALLVGFLAWNWHRAGGILLIFMAVYIFSFWSIQIHLEGLYYLFTAFIAATSLIGGILHLVVSPWGRRLWHKSSKA